MTDPAARNVAIRAAILYTLQLSDKDIRALAPERFVAALEQDGFTVVPLRALTAATARADRLETALREAADWLEAESFDPRPDPRPAMRSQIKRARAALAASEEDK